MTLPDQTPKLPKLPFFLADAALLATAWLVARNAHDPSATGPLIAIVGCVFAAALLVAIPFLADYARKQDEALDDRQRALEALARTVTTAAEQISIAAGGLNEIAELAQKALRHAEHLPQKLHEKIAEFQAQLANVNDDEKEELEKEVAELRAAESERLQSISEKIAKSAAEWGKLEAATQKHFAAAAAALDEKLATLDVKLAALDAAAKNLSAVPPPASPASELAPTDTPPASAEVPLATAHPPKRPRKPRREEPAAESSASSAVTPPQADEPPPVPAEKIPEVAPVAPHTAEPFTGEVPAAPSSESAPPATPAAPDSTPKPEKPPRKRAPKKTAPAEGEPSLGLVEPPQAAPAAEIVERVVSSDGATRLLVTAYIGIGNRLFIRGDGPGLSWDHGVPMQFVSIGKWGWFTHEASGPVRIKLYKNDELAALSGEITLEPGRHSEVTALF